MWELTITQKEKEPLYFEHKVRFVSDSVDLLFDLIYRMCDMNELEETKYTITRREKHKER